MRLSGRRAPPHRLASRRSRRDVKVSPQREELRAGRELDLELERGARERGEPVVYYRVRATREADERSTVVHRRFRDFAALNDAVRAAYKGSQLLGSFPQPPPRGNA